MTDQYVNLALDVLENGVPRLDRTGTGTVGVFGRQLRFDLQDGFPLLTTKRLHTPSIVHELIWLISGRTNTRYLDDNGVRIWREWQNEDGFLGPVYGQQWRAWESIKLVTPLWFDPQDPTLIGSGEPAKDLIFGVGYGGFLPEGELGKSLYNTWHGMLRRCYDESSKEYKWYGGSGVHVDPRWFDFGVFLEDVKMLRNWSLKRSNPELYTLDKDWHASNRYGPYTCTWASGLEQHRNTSTLKPVVAMSPTGNEYTTIAIKRFAEDVGLDPSTVYKCLRGERENHKGWSFRYLDLPPGQIVRVRYIDQLARVINDIKERPTSRRHIVSAWNVAEVDNMALPPCHAFFQFYVRPPYLDMQMYQRSADLFLGVPFNIASYALLLSMVAQVTDYEPGEFIHTFGDVHIYQNHLEQVKKQVQRKPFKLPTLMLDKSIDHIDDFRAEHIYFSDYQSHPHIKGAVSI